MYPWIQWYILEITVMIISPGCSDRFDMVDAQFKQLTNQAGNPTGCMAFALRLIMLEDNSSLLVVNSHFKGKCGSSSLPKTG